jgi:DivIVA domain-containing protein
MDQKPLTPADVHDVIFDKAPLGKRGYDEKQVDAFLDRIEAALTGTGRLSAEDVRAVVFQDAPLIRRGYHEDQVDTFLDAVIGTLEQRERRHADPPTAPGRLPRIEQTEPMVFAQPPSLADEDPDAVAHLAHLTHVAPPSDLLALPLPPAPPGTRGYRPGDVEKLARLLAEAVERVDGPTAADIRTVPLHRTFFNGQGYRTDVVDTIVAAWVEELRRREG